MTVREYAIKLPTHQSFELCNLITKEYKSLDISDTAFAKIATKKLGFPIKWTHVYHRRRALGVVKPKVTPVKPKVTSAKINLFYALEERIERLEKKFKDLLVRLGEVE